MKSERPGRLDESRRLSALEALADDVAPESVPLLARALDDESWRVRRAAVAGLVRRGGEAAVGAVLSAMRDDPLNLAVLNGSIQVLAQAGVDTLGELSGFLTNPEVELRIGAALTLGVRGDIRAVPTLVAAMADPDPNVRYHAIEALGRLRAGQAVDALASLAESGDFSLAFPALDALGMIGDTRVAHRLAPLLQDAMMQTAAVEALGRLGGEEAVAPLAQLLNAPDVPPGVVAGALAALHDRYETSYGKGDHVAGLTRRAVAPAGARRLIDAIDGASAADLRSLALVLGWLEGGAAERALAGLLGREPARKEAAEALVRRGPGATELLVEQLGAGDPETRQAAVTALGRIGDARAVPALLRMLADDEGLAAAVAGALAMTGDRRAYAPLLGLVGHADATVRRAAVSALNSLGHPDMAADAAALLLDPRPLVRESAAKLVGYAGFASCVEPLLERCRDEHEGVRRAAVEALPTLEDGRVLPALALALRGGSPRLRAAAARALGQVEGERAWPLLRAAAGDEDAWVRYFAVRSIGRLRPAGALGVLARLAQADPAMQVRVASVEAIGLIGGSGVLTVLESLAAAADADLAGAALAALGATGAPDALPALLAALESPDPVRRSVALRAIGVWGRPEAVDSLRRAASDVDSGVARAAIDALARTPSPEAVDALLDLAALPSHRDACVAALARAGGAHADWLGRGLHHAHLDVRRATVEALARVKDPRASDVLAGALGDAEAAVRLAALTALALAGAAPGGPEPAALAGNDPAAPPAAHAGPQG